MTEKIQLHYSMLNQLEGCGEQFRRRYGYLFGWNDKPEIIPPGVALIIGIATHKSIESNLNNIITEKVALPLDAVTEIAFSEASGAWQQEVFLSDDETANIEKTKGDSIDMAVSLAALHAVNIAPLLFPSAVERKWVIKLDGYPVDLAGTIDIEEEIASNEGSTIIHIRDTKTAGKSPSAADADSSNQLSMYALAKKVVDGKLPDRIFLDALVKTKVPKSVTLETTRTEFQLQVLFRRIERAVEIIEKGAFMPCQPTDWHCTKKFCGYSVTCKFWGGR
jgi:hypothetical protein